jgi:hypothetical protein
MALTSAALTMYLTTEEQKMFSALSATMQDAWNVQEEKITFADSPEKMEIRLRNLDLSSPKLLSLKEKAESAKTRDEFLANIDIAELSQDETMELYFALGPNVLSEFIVDAIGKIQNSDDLQNLGVLTIIRHNLLISLTES